MSNQLSSTQDNIIKTLMERLDRYCRETLDLGEDRSQVATQKREQFSNLFGIFAPRGGGKSTVLNGILKSLRTSSKAKAGTTRFRVAPSIDCSIIPEEIEPAMAVLLNAFPKAERDEMDEELRKELEDIIETYIHLTQEYKELRQDLASSPSHLGQKLILDVEARLGLASSLAKWLQKILEREGQEALVVILDDFDLVPEANTTSKLLHSLLDELHQPQIIFVLAADYYRLEHILADPEMGFDKETGLAQLEKLFPWQHRLELPPWTPWERLGFPFSRGGEIQPLGELLNRKLPEILHRPAVHRLLPYHPRGIQNLYQVLSEPEPIPDEVAQLRNFFSLLAQSRREHALSRHLAEANLFDWRASLATQKRKEEPVSIRIEDWQQMVDVAISRAKDTKKDLPEVDAGERESYEVFYELGSLLGQRSQGLAQESADMEDRDTSERARRLIAPEGRSAALWAELLLDLSFTVGAESESHRLLNRVRLLEEWAPLALRSQNARIQARIPRADFRNFFVDYEDLDLGSLLSWCDWDPSESSAIHFQAGWYPLLLNLRENRIPLILEKTRPLDINIRGILQGASKPPSPERLNLIPDKLWAIILFIEALDRCPWEAFSARLTWSVPTHLLMAGALIQGAYHFAMKLANSAQFVESNLNNQQQNLLKAVETSNPSLLLIGSKDQEEAAAFEAGFEENIFARLQEILDAEWPVIDDPIGRAAKAFRELPQYKALRDLANEELLI